MPKGHYHTDPNINPYHGYRFLCHGKDCKGEIFMSIYEAKKKQPKEYCSDFLKLIEALEK